MNKPIYRGPFSGIIEDVKNGRKDDYATKLIAHEALDELSGVMSSEELPESMQTDFRERNLPFLRGYIYSGDYRRLLQCLDVIERGLKDMGIGLDAEPSGNAR